MEDGLQSKSYTGNSSVKERYQATKPHENKSTKIIIYYSTQNLDYTNILNTSKHHFTPIPLSDIDANMKQQQQPANTDSCTALLYREQQTKPPKVGSV